MEAVAKKQSPVLMPDRCKHAEFTNTRWTVNVESGRTPQDILAPSYWSHTAFQMQPFDEIQARAEDGKWVAYLVVRFCEKNFAIMHLDRLIEFKDNAEIPETSIRHKVEWKGPQHQYAVIRLSDSQMLHSKCKTREEAAEWLRNHENAG